jgi:hypothetical protein
MAKRKKVEFNGRGLFDDQLHQLEQRIRRQRALFIPHLLHDEASKNLDKDPESEERAYAIALKWAELDQPVGFSSTKKRRSTLNS